MHDGWMHPKSKHHEMISPHVCYFWCLSLILEYLLSCEYTFCLFIYSEHVPWQGALDFALMMLRMDGGFPVDYNKIADLFLQVYLILSFVLLMKNSLFSLIKCNL